MAVSSPELSGAHVPVHDAVALPARSGTLEALKWIALICMLGDHIDAALFDRSLPFLGELGRIAFPLFAYVLGANLAREVPQWESMYRRIATRLLVFALVATPFSALAFARYDLLPLNVLFTLAASVGLVWCIRRNDVRAAIVGSLVFLGAGAVVEFWWAGLLLVVAAWAFHARPGAASYACALLALAGLWFVNQNFYALAAVPVVWLVGMIAPRVPRYRWAFYVFYPAHLAVLALLRHLLA